MDSNISELVKLGHERAEELKASCGAVDVRSVAQLISDLATQLDVQLVRSNALAAENAGLKAFGDKLNEMHNDLNGEGTGIQGRAEVACQQAALEAAMEEFDALKTPATDAFLAEVRASALPENIAEIIDSGDLETICWQHEHYKAEDYRLALYRFRTDRAAQLRKGVQS